MVLRLCYVSNSSSSSFICWGPDAKEFASKFLDSGVQNVYNVGSFAWHKIEGWYRSKDLSEYRSIPDYAWKEQFYKEPGALYRIVPATVYEEMRVTDPEDWYRVFPPWFAKAFEHETFWGIEFSDHEGETQYPEEEMDQRCAPFRGPGMYVCMH